MTDTNDDDRLERLIRDIEPGGRLLRTWRLKGGSSAEMTPFEIALPNGRTTKLILRRPNAGSAEPNPRAAADEYGLLIFLRSAGLPVPVPRHLDQSAELFATPYLIIEYLEGEPDYAPTDMADAVRQLAACLAQIHRIDGNNPALVFVSEHVMDFTNNFRNTGEHADKSPNLDKILKTLESTWPPPRPNRPALLHGDFWPGNILWQGGRLAAVIDWEDAERGEPLADLAISRLDLQTIYGAESMEVFTRHYQSLTAIDFTDLPYWDLHAALRAGPGLSEWGDGWAELGRDDITEQTMRAAHQAFTDQAMEALSDRQSK